MANFAEPDRIQKWAKGEARSANKGTGRSAVGAAVTGHKAKVKAGGGSLRTLASGSVSTMAAAPRKPVKSASALSVLSDKSDRFS
jgi:mediator of replication checkpoint protein 1